MTQVQTSQATFGKKTQKQLLELVPTAVRRVKVGNDFVIKNAEGDTVATWQKRSLKNGLLVIW